MPDHRPPASVMAKLQRFDRELSLRWCQDRWGLYRRGVRIGSVAHDLLGDGSMLLSKLYHTDIRRQHGSAEHAATYFEQTEQHEKVQRDRQRRTEFVDQGKEAYDDLARRAGRRINNAGMPGS